MKHIQIDLHFVHDLVQKGNLQVRHVHTQDQLADLFTKPLSKQRTEFLRTKIGLANGSSIHKNHRIVKLEPLDPSKYVSIFLIS
jgi:hypothetical protein